jgi:hypothetical protein
MTANKLWQLGKGLLWAALLVFMVFFLNVFLAGPLGITPFFNDLQEMLVLFFAVVLFTSGTLALEARANLLKANPPPGD